MTGMGSTSPLSKTPALSRRLVCAQCFPSEIQSQDAVLRGEKETRTPGRCSPSPARPLRVRLRRRARRPPQDAGNPAAEEERGGGGRRGAARLGRALTRPADAQPRRRGGDEAATTRPRGRPGLRRPPDPAPAAATARPPARSPAPSPPPAPRLRLLLGAGGTPAAAPRPPRPARPSAGPAVPLRPLPAPGTCRRGEGRDVAAAPAPGQSHGRRPRGRCRPAAPRAPRAGGRLLGPRAAQWPPAPAQSPAEGG